MAPVLKKINKQVNIHHLSPTKVIMWGYSLIILVGSVLLCLPVSSRSSTFTNFLDCVFTATSATCVTGLVIYDTYTHWSLFGQLVILLLIQIGGLGFMTLAISAVTLTKKHIGLRERYTMKEAISAPTVGGVVRISRFIFLTSIAIEATGALLLSIKFIPQFGIVRGIYFSIFHSISAFCNAGFDLMGIIKPFSSLATYQGSVLVNLVICFLIIIGGLGFFVWDDIRIHRFKINKYKLHTKIVLTVTSTLILIGFLSIFIFESRYTSFDNLPIKNQILVAFFQSVAPRTAGFNTIDLASISDESQILTICLMLIGGSPSSTAGGIKTTTLAVMVLSILTELRNKKHIECFNRRIDEQTVRHAYSVLTMYLFFFLSGAILISAIDGVSVSKSIFETSSAIGTVGSTLGITSQLSAISHSILILLMYVGRVGGLTILVAFAKPYPNTVSQMPLENITIG
ncbi:MAG: TrkH family potassium uptake protein [Acutalibacteraceae bacterium]|jgi:trk system potassium uptake protein TrkH